MEFPRLVYKYSNKTISHELAKEREDFDNLIKSGWFESVPAAMEGKKAEVIEEDSAPTRAEMEEQAKSMGIKFDGRTSDTKLLTLIHEALEK